MDLWDLKIKIKSLFDSKEEKIFFRCLEKPSYIKKYPELCNNLDFMKKALVHTSADVFEYAADYMKTDRNIVLELARISGRIYKFLPDELKQDHEVITTCIESDGACLQHVPEKYRLDRDVVLTACKTFGIAFFETPFEDDEEIVLTGISNVPMAYVYAKGKLVNNRDFALKAFKAHHLAFAFMENFHDDREIAKIAISNNPRAYKYASNRLHDDDELFLMAAKQVPSMAEYASERLVKKYMRPKKS